MKRLPIITKPTAVNDLADIDSDDYESAAALRAERWAIKRRRKFRQQGS